MESNRATHRNIDEYIASFLTRGSGDPRENTIDDQEQRTRCAGDNQLQNANVQDEGRPSVFCRIQETHRFVSAGEGRCKFGEGHLNLCGREGQPAISTRSTDPIWTDRKNCEAPSEAR